MAIGGQARLPRDLDNIPTPRHSEALSILVETGYIQFELLQFKVPGEQGLLDHFVIYQSTLSLASLLRIGGGWIILGMWLLSVCSWRWSASGVNEVMEVDDLITFMGFNDLISFIGFNDFNFSCSKSFSSAQCFLL